MGRVWAGRWEESCGGQGAVAGSGRIKRRMAGRAQLVVKTPHVQACRTLNWSRSGRGMLVLLSTKAVTLRVVTSVVEGVRRPRGGHVGERS